jgi:hypothetical protein
MQPATRFTHGAVPMIYRAMRRAEDGLPVVGYRSNELGVRVPPHDHSDVDVNDANEVALNRQGMSVVSEWRCLPVFLVPKHLRPFVPGAVGSNALAIWRMGRGPFEDGPIGAGLALASKEGTRRHGVVVPIERMTIARFQAALAATRNDWKIDVT